MIIVGLFSVAPSPLPENFPANDFRAYWTASYLLRQGEDFTDPVLVFQVEQAQTFLATPYPIIIWNPPWLLIFLSPFTLMPFGRALFAWLMTCIALIFASAALIGRLDSRTTAPPWLAPVVAFAFSSTLVALVAGQVNVLVLAGLAGYLLCTEKRLDIGAGIALVFTTVKPQLVYLALPIILLDLLLMRRWRALLGFASVLLAATLPAFILRPTLVMDYARSVGNGQLFAYETPTMGGLLDFLFGWRGLKLMGVVVLPLALALWWKYRERLDKRTFIDLALMVGAITMPFGWSYDFIVLLIPLSRIVAWLADGSRSRIESMFWAGILILANTFTFYLRATADRELVYAWVPIAVLAIYITLFMRRPKVRSEASFAE